MAARTETPFSSPTSLFAGEFRRARLYRNWRSQGSGDCLLIYTVAGAGYLTTARRAGATREGEVTLYTPGEPQDYRTDPASGHWHLLWTHFAPNPSWQAWLQWPAGEHGVKSVVLPSGEVRENFHHALKRLLRLHRRQLPNATDFTFNALEEALLWAHLAAGRGAWMRTDPRIRKAMDYLATDLRQPFHLKEVARRIGLSVSRLAHLFKSETGFSPQQFFEERRMGQARQLLQRTGLGIAEIAAEVGYDDPFYFSNRFRRHAGKSPSQFRGGREADTGKPAPARARR